MASITHYNWRKGLFRLWLSAAVLWWLALTTGVVAEASREAMLELRNSRGMLCGADSALFALAVPSSCRTSADQTPIPRLSREDLLRVFSVELQTAGRWTRWAYLVWAPIMVLVAAAVARSWTGWMLRGFATRVSGEATAGSEGSAPLTTAVPTASTAGKETGGRDGAVGEREQAFRESIVRATQSLNALDGELVELDARLFGSSRELTQALHDQIPAFGHNLIELVRAIDKEGLAPSEPLFAQNVKRIRPKAMD